MKQKGSFLLLPSNQERLNQLVIVIVAIACVGQLCIQTTLPTTNITFWRNIWLLYITLPPAKNSYKRDFSWPVLSTYLYSLRSGCDKSSKVQTWKGNTHGHMQWVILIVSEIRDHCHNFLDDPRTSCYARSVGTLQHVINTKGIAFIN